ncbi:Rieske (2Fe-2S) protein [Nocardioides rubriscoriae]|uniref:Rieske (2Fe-2S) protein n=1 Tax=Nocardioides rubriscoriae TaxID=642762 RepID=UPI001FE8C794|nr:Rieske (2Fe-2S) protein [Nocardioides rubriscoriae]
MTVPRSALTRRSALAGVTGAGLALPVLAACGGEGVATGGASPTSTTASTTQPTSQPTTEPPGADGSIPVADVPVGSGVVVLDPQVVVTQPTEGEIKVFSSICTHSGCPVSDIEGSVITCRCHGSTFDAATGAVLGGPAPAPLAPVDFTVQGDRVVVS